VEATVKIVDTVTVYPLEARNDWRGSLAGLGGLWMRRRVVLVSGG
jgi:hypothetical protein